MSDERVDPKFEPAEPEEGFEWDTDEASVGVCNHCGAKRLVKPSVDPFIEEVYAGEAESRDLEETSWCAACWFARKEEV